jgi:hypothetical protein
MFSGSGPGCVEALGAHWREAEEKVRAAIDLVADATERPEPRRIKERAEAMVYREQWLLQQVEGTGARRGKTRLRGWSAFGHMT